jgi:YfiH family protein
VDWLPADWAAPPGVVAGITLRTGGVSQGPYASLNLGAHAGDDAAAVSENRSRFRAMCDLPAEPRWLRQVHGCAVVTEPTVEVEADASVTRQPGNVCVVMVADCLPVILASDDGAVIAAAHAGWRGLAAGVIENTLQAMNCAPERIVAWLGPAISRRAFEVGGEVRDAYVGPDPGAAACFEPNEKGRFMADLAGLARRRLAAAGVTAVHGGDRCTYSEPASFFSYRRDGQCGRMAAFAFRRP